MGMNNYNVLPTHLRIIADAADEIIKVKYGLANTIVETAIHSSISWTPTLHWKTKLGYIACEVHEIPNPPSIRTAFGDGSTTDLPIKIIIAIPKNIHISLADFIKGANEAKRFGCALLTINDDGTGEFQHEGIEIPLYLPTPNFGNYNKKIRAEVQHAFELYINSDPRHGVQEIGQLIESIIIHLALQAIKKRTLTKGGYTNPANRKRYATGNLIDDLMREKVIDNAILGKCRGFVEDRNNSSHKPKSVTQAIEVNKKLKNAMASGLQILEEIPAKLKAKNYQLKIM